jgi:coenzyme F420-reducing hydrogenase alpha subunit
MRERSLDVPILARVEGEGALHLTIRGGQVVDARLRIYEPPRFFEALLRGRRFDEPVDITARICGICPVAYQMSAVQALEAACRVTVDDAIDDLRRLLYCGEWIESHLLHMVMLHAPDFLGLASGIEMARDHRDRGEVGLRIKQLGNRIVEVVGGRAIHPVNVRVGGFHKVPLRRDLTALLAAVELALAELPDLVRWMAHFSFPELEQDVGYVSLRHPTEYPMHRGVVARSWDSDLRVDAWPGHFVEVQVPHSTAFHAQTIDGREYAVGPLARYELCGDRMAPEVRAFAAEIGMAEGTRNPFRTLLVRGLEAYEALFEARRLIEAYRPPERSFVPVEPRPGVGHGATEAPRGLLYHRYEIAADGSIAAATIVPPTSQNQAAIERDLRTFAQGHVHLSNAALERRCEQVVRNFDPCISCSTHFMRMSIERS